MRVSWIGWMVDGFVEFEVGFVVVLKILPSS